MERQVIFRDRQELQSADLNASQSGADQALQHVVTDAVSGGLHYTGLYVTASSATEAGVSTGRFYNDGKVYALDQAQNLNLFQYLPLVTKKIVAVVAWGQEIETNVEPRDFLIDLTTGATQPEAVAMQSLRLCNVNVLPGAESVDPQPPVIQNGTLAVAYVYLTPIGIERVEMQAGALLPNAKDHGQRIGGLEVWKAAAEPRISSIATDLAGLAQKTDGKADRESIIALANDIKTLAEKQVVPAAAVAYTANYGDATQTDATGAGYSAITRDAILFNYAASAQVNLALFSPIEPAVKVAANGLVLPAYDNVPRIATRGYAGDVAISGYQIQAWNTKKYKVPTHTRHYGPHANHHPKWYARHGWDSYGTAVDFTTEAFGYLKLTPKDTYTLDAAVTVYNGSLLAQTVLVPNAMWLTQLGLNFTGVAAAGDVTVAVVETKGGKPMMDQALTVVTVPQASLKTFPDETVIDVPPAFLDAGKRYAIVVVTQGNHRLALVDRGPNTQGTLFYGQDGGYSGFGGHFDLLFTLYGARFASSRTEVMLQAPALAGGMTDLRLDAPHVIPKGCEFHYEIQPAGAGVWYKLGDPVLRLAGGPNLVNLRAVFTGTSDLSAALVLTNNAITVSRPDIAQTWWSTARTVPSTTNITVSALVSAWDAANHALTPKVVIGVTEYAPSVTTSTTEDGAKRFKYTFSVPATTTYKIKLVGTRAAGSNPFAVVELVDAAS